MDYQLELEEIRKNNGGVLKAADVVEYARNPDTALHRRFTWDDDKAAHEYRLWQARELIRVVVKMHPQTNKITRTYVSLGQDRDQEGGGYREINAVMRNTSYREQLLEEAKSEMRRFEIKYAVLEELADVFASMRQARSLKVRQSEARPAVTT